MLKADIKYQATLIAYGIRETEKGPRVWAQFNIAEGNHATVVSWDGTFSSEKAEQRTLAALMTMGHKGAIADIQGGINSGALNEKQTYSITLEPNNYTKKDGTPVRGWKVKYVNSPTDPRFQEAHKKMQGELSKYDAKLNAMKAKAGIKPDYDPGI